MGCGQKKRLNRRKIHGARYITFYCLLEQNVSGTININKIGNCCFYDSIVLQLTYASFRESIHFHEFSLLKAFFKLKIL